MIMISKLFSAAKLSLVVSIIVLGLASGITKIQAQSTVFSAEELSQYDGKDGHPAYFAYEGKVYDVSESTLWKMGEHFGVHAGEDLTGQLGNAPHGTEVFASFPVVGTYQNETSETNEAVASVAPTAQETMPTSVSSKKWYEGRIRLMNISILGWSGILLGVFFILTFGTCFAMPWAKLPLPWKGSKLGPDPLDSAPKHMTWSSIHKHFVWWTVIFGVIHGVLGLLQMFGLYL